MKIFFKDLASHKIDKLIINSLEQALYQAMVEIEGQEYVVWENDKKTLTTRSLVEIRERLEHLAVAEIVLRQESPYDEMVGLGERAERNRMEVPLGKNPYPEIPLNTTRH